MDEREGGPQRLQDAISAALKIVAKAGKLQASSQKALEATMAALDERLGTGTQGVRFTVEPAAGQCLVVVHSSDPVALDVMATFLHHGGASKIGSAKVWLLPLEGLPINRWARGMRRVVSATRRRDDESLGGLPVRLTLVWSQEGEMMVATLG